MKSEIQINNTAGVCQIDIEGTIGVPEEWQFEEPDARVATYERFRDTLRRIAEIEAPEVVVNIRSTGGDVNDALLIHDALRQLPARVTTRCYGYTASAATIIAQAPKMRPHIDQMRQNMADALKIDVSQINVKATTEEGLGFTGAGEGISAQAICLLNSPMGLYDQNVISGCGGCGGCGVQ